MQRQRPVRRTTLMHPEPPKWKYANSDDSYDEHSQDPAEESHSEVENDKNTSSGQMLPRRPIKTWQRQEKPSLERRKSYINYTREEVDASDLPMQLAWSVFSFLSLSLFSNLNGSLSNWFPWWLSIPLILLINAIIGFILGAAPMRHLLWSAFGNKEAAAVGTILWLLWLTSKVLPAVFELLDEMNQRGGALVTTPLLLLFLWSASVTVFGLGFIVALVFSWDIAGALQRGISMITRYLFRSVS